MYYVIPNRAKFVVHRWPIFHIPAAFCNLREQNSTPQLCHWGQAQLSLAGPPPAGFFRACRVGFWVWYIHSCFNLCSAGFGMFRMYSPKKKNSHLRVSPTVGSMRRWWVFCLDGLAQKNTLRDSDGVPRCWHQRVDFFLCPVPGFWAM